MNDIPQRIDHEKLSRVVDQWEIYAEMKSTQHWGKFIVKDDDNQWTACNNAEGQCDVEDFTSEIAAIAFLDGCDLDKAFYWNGTGFELKTDPPEMSLIQKPLDHWIVMGDIENDTELGRFQFENEFLTDYEGLKAEMILCNDG